MVELITIEALPDEWYIWRDIKRVFQAKTCSGTDDDLKLNLTKVELKYCTTPFMKDLLRRKISSLSNNKFGLLTLNSDQSCSSDTSVGTSFMITLR